MTTHREAEVTILATSELIIEYLTQLEQRTKSFSKDGSLKTDYLVLVKSENFASTPWPLESILALYSGKHRSLIIRRNFNRFVFCPTVVLEHI